MDKLTDTKEVILTDISQEQAFELSQPGVGKLGESVMTHYDPATRTFTATVTSSKSVLPQRTKDDFETYYTAKVQPK